MADEKKKVKGQGRNKRKSAIYWMSKRRDKRKLRRVLRSSGPRAAAIYAESRGLQTYLRTLRPSVPA